MGRTLKPAPADTKQTKVDALLAANELLEIERVAIMSRPRTVAGQIEHQWLSVQMLSNLRSIAMVRGKVSEIVALTNAIDKAEDALRGLQKNKIDDELSAMAARIEGFDDARHILADAKDDE